MPDDPTAEHIETVVIGAGQAGLAVGYHLARTGQPFVILEGSDRVGSSWRDRWEGLRLFTQAKYDSLPGMRFPGPRHALPTKDAVADYLERYASAFDLPIRTGVLVDTVAFEAARGAWRIASGEQRWTASTVVLATGAYRAPRIPDFAAGLRPEITQVHASGYRDPSQLQDGLVLVVGASNSGAEIAMSAARAHPVILSGRDTGTMPVRPDSRMARLFDPPFWFFLNHVVRADTVVGRKARSSVVDRGGPLERIRPSDLAAVGVERAVGRTVGVEDGWPVLGDGRVIRASNVIWCTGFRPDFDWVKPTITGDDGWPIHRRGEVTGVEGLYVVGLPLLHSGASALLGGVGRDAGHIADRIAVRASTGRRPATLARIARA